MKCPECGGESRNMLVSFTLYNSEYGADPEKVHVNPRNVVTVKECVFHNRFFNDNLGARITLDSGEEIEVLDDDRTAAQRLNCC